MNWLYVYEKNTERVKFMLNMDSILSVHFEYNGDKLEKIWIFMPGDVYRLDNKFDQDKILKRLGL